jgi:SAM-dependent methyltransferase
VANSPSTYLANTAATADRVFRRRLDDVGELVARHLVPGVRVLDCGCGGGGLTIQIAERVSPGRVVGIDNRPEQFVRGIEVAKARGLTNLEFLAGDIRCLTFPPETFDVVFMHAVLYHLAERDRVLSEALRVLRPGGVLLTRDSDHGADLIHPSIPALRAALDVAARLVSARGGDPYLGHALRAVLRAAGFIDVEATGSFDHYGSEARIGEAREMFRDVIHRVESAATSDRLPVAPELWSEARAAIEEWAADPDAFYATCRVTAAGSKPR